ncbi:MAG TPA: reverse transcriptase domain-containing protein, partial [Methylomicrobium sp.]|nr:reverse transcriptase domain-containing protein [Methylomicrobium sp.]
PRHPLEPTDRCALPNPLSYSALQTMEDEVIKAIRLFPAGSSAGPDGLRPQHLPDLVNCQDAGRTLIAAITALTNFLLDGRCPPEVSALLFGGKLFALSKKSGGVRPIAIGYTFRRLVAKCANNCAISLLSDKLLPYQLGVGIPGGCEAVVHATRRFMAEMSSGEVVVKLDFSNAFNCLRRDVMLKSVADELPFLYRFCRLAYGNGTALLFGNQTLWSLEGVQQGDPLGPLLFCLTIQPLLRSLSSELVVAYMDDVTLGGQQSLVADDVEKISALGVEYGLRLNVAKCEAISLCGITSHATLVSFQQFTPETATLLGAPLSTGQALTDSLTARCADLARAVDRLNMVSAHDALLLMKNSLSAPKLLHILRSAFCDGHELLKKFDDILKSALCTICNVSLTEQQWLQASLPVRAGGLGIRRVSSLAPSAFLASAAGTRDLQDLILRQSDKTSDDIFDRCLSTQLIKFPTLPPSGSDAGQQRAWDKAVVEAEYNYLFNCYTDPIHKARLRAAAAPHSGDWLHALPIAACGLRLDNDSVLVAVGLRFGCALCQIHTCPCGATVDTMGSHAWSCRHNAARIQRHAFINDLIYIQSIGQSCCTCCKRACGFNSSRWQAAGR